MNEPSAPEANATPVSETTAVGHPPAATKVFKLKRRVWCPKCHRGMLPVNGFQFKVWRCGGCKRTWNAKVEVVKPKGPVISTAPEQVDVDVGGDPT